MNRIRLAAFHEYTEWPAPVDIQGKPYFLVREQTGQYRLLSATCPHMGGTIAKTANGGFECPVHNWKFDGLSGQCLNNRNQKMKDFEAVLEDGIFYALLEESEPDRDSSSARTSGIQVASHLSVTLHSHACLEFRSPTFSLLTDPWLDGPCFMGAWIPYPAPRSDGSDLKPDAIWISHEHSDHFHEPTLAHFDRNTPIYVPDFPNRRLVDRLAELGFRRVTAMPFGERIRIAENHFITCYEPISLWNDAIVLMEIDGFRFLNLNDAGLNPQIAKLIGPVDAISSGFSPGASGYPLTWTHLNLNEQQEIMRKSCTGLLTMLEKAMALYHAEYLLPFASHFELWHPSHQDYVKHAVKNTLDDVLEFFRGKPVKVIDLLPGERWQPATNAVTRIGYDRKALYDPALKKASLEALFDPERFARAYPSSAQKVSTDEVAAYLERLNEVPEIIFSEDVKVHLRVKDRAADDAYDVPFQIQDGRLTFMDTPAETFQMFMELPVEIMAAIVKEQLSWDEAIIGYWCSFSRNPDVYHGDFWRLLQAPYYRKAPGISRSDSLNGGMKSMAVAELLEKHGDEADRILRRYGMYCLGCHRSPQESLELAAQAHGIPENKIERLFAEMNALFSSEVALIGKGHFL